MNGVFSLAIGGAASLVLQAVLAPNIAVLGAMPNFALVYVATTAMLRRSDSTIVAAFVLGLLCDACGGGTVGIMAALFTLAAFVASRASALFGNDTVATSLAISMVSALLVEVCYALFYVATAGVPPIEALTLRALPCALYDCAMVLIFMPALSHLSDRAAPSHAAPSTSTVRLR